MEKRLVLVAYGRHDRGKLFPKTRRQVHELKDSLNEIVGTMNSGNVAGFHDGTLQAEQTIDLLGLPADANLGYRDFLLCPARLGGPEEFEMVRALHVIEHLDKEIVVFAVDRLYVAKFASFYLSRLGKGEQNRSIPDGSAVVIEQDGKCHILVPLN
jgi:hypothetical protein